ARRDARERGARARAPVRPYPCADLLVLEVRHRRGQCFGDSPHALQRIGRWSEAASRWRALGCPYDRALALIEGDAPAMRESLRILESLGASATVARCREQLHAGGTRGIPPGPL